MYLNFRKLTENDIKVRVQQCKKTKTNKVYADYLLYKDARCDQQILDETVGPFNWQRDHKEIKGNVYCGVSVWDEEKKQWITKWDCGTESNTEAEKGEASDSFKRACFNLGIGRELYTSPSIRIWLNEEDYYTSDKGSITPTISLKVKKIKYFINEISELVLVDLNGAVRFQWRKDIKAENTPENKTIKQVLSEKPFVAPTQESLDELEQLGGTLNMVAIYFKVNEEQVSEDMVKSMIAAKKKSLAKSGGNN